jgi:prepilin-type N-terminal cleavage/methylation domain-containing protein
MNIKGVFMRNAFTMIELVFTIVIIGILATVAVPKLAATREDAKDATIKANVARCLTDAVALYTARQVVPDESISKACNSGVDVSISGDSVIVQQTLSNGTVFSITRPYKGVHVSY